MGVLDFSRALAIALAASTAVCGVAVAQQYPDPNKPIRVVSTAAAGGGTDAIVRFISAELQKVAGTQVVVENKPGAQGNLGIEFVSKSRPDGYTLTMTPSSTPSSVSYMYKTPPYDALKDLIHVTTLIDTPLVMAVGINSPNNTVAELTESIKKKGSAAYGTTVHLLSVASESYGINAGLKLIRVPYRGVPDLLNEMLGGQIDFAILGATFPVEQARAGRMKLLAVTSAKRSPHIPHVPTFVESGYPNLVIGGWWVAMVAPGTPQPIVSKLEGWLNQIVQSPEAKPTLATFVAEPVVGNQQIATEMMRRDVAKWAEYAKIAGIEPQ